MFADLYLILDLTSLLHYHLGESLPQYETFPVHVCGCQKHHIVTVTLQQLCGFQQYLVPRFDTRILVGGTRQLTAVEYEC